MKKMSEERIKTKLSQKITDSRRLKFLELYLTPGTKYFNNGYQSAIKAGFTENTAVTILSKYKWVTDGIKMIRGNSIDTQVLAEKSRKVLSKSLDSDDPKIAQDTAKFISSHIDPDFIQKQEVNIQLPSPIYGGKSKESDIKKEDE
ncbi:hypothetical protein HG463_001195 [Candidatus Saccharibacteria bacterium]|nr:hypothetical protein [Candidatus Saccharibacteria bacterium]